MCWWCLFEDCRDVFSLIIKKLGDAQETLYSFVISDEMTNKSEFLPSLSKTVCASQCRADYVSFPTFLCFDVIDIRSCVFRRNPISLMLSVTCGLWDI